jgi:prepilin-type N-terminal cleavage/methylation domain-containing protein/prepilin-type processing-associated H-X9-DG protein
MRRPHAIRAFTLVELLVVIGIIAVLISVLLPALTQARQQANDVKCQSNVRQLATALLNYAAEFKGKFPPNINAGEMFPTPPPEAPSANLWYDLDRLGRYLPKGTMPRPEGTTTNPTIGGTIFICPSDLDGVQRSYSMNVWASSVADQFVLNSATNGFVYKPPGANSPKRGTLFTSSGKGATQLILLAEAHPKNAVAAGRYASATLGYQGTKAGDRFLGIPGYVAGSFADPGLPGYIYALAETEIAWYKHRKKGQQNAGRAAIGRATIGFADGHVEILGHDDVATRSGTVKTSKLRALWSPYDRFMN